MDEPLLPVVTPRLVLRPLAVRDLDALVAYRNDPGVARYQEWRLPFDAASALDLLAGTDADRLVAGRWTQVAVEHDGHLAGDVGVHLHPSRGTVRIGYTVAPAMQGRGIATEAIGALLERVFAMGAVHRVEASADPANLPSQRLLEGQGFQRCGTTRSSVHVRGTWRDDACYELLRDDHHRWKDRPRRSPAVVRLVELDYDRLERAMELATFGWQRRYVAPMEWSLAEALVPEPVDGSPVTPWYRLVEADGQIVAFVMLAAADPSHPVPYLWRLLVDRHHQRRGIGSRALMAVAATLRTQGRSTLLTSWVPGPGSPEAFYRKLGFAPTGRLVDDEVEACVDLATSLR